jgi:hypothetical protein|tara:strand:+ start:1293 stop:1589 length:297 start_codon:yes stop_codon:yes gene_type:complete
MRTEDPIVDAVIDKFVVRSAEGMKRFGISMEDNNSPAVYWIDQAQEEAMDLVLYLERLKKELINGRSVRVKNGKESTQREDILDEDRRSFSHEGEGWV